MNKVLITGFDRFGHTKQPNRSSELALPAIKRNYGDLVETLVLPTAHDIAAQQLIEAIEEISPAAIAMFGMSAGHRVRLEEQAKNRRMSVLFPDNQGVRKLGRIDEEGPWKYSSTLPLEDLETQLSAAGVPVKASKDAGAFVCNEVMYKALQHIDAQNGAMVPTGFIHLGNGLSDQLVEEAALAIVDGLITHTATMPDK